MEGEGGSGEAVDVVGGVVGETDGCSTAVFTVNHGFAIFQMMIGIGSDDFTSTVDT